MLVGPLVEPEQREAQAEFSKTVRSGEVDPFDITLEDDEGSIPPRFRRNVEPGEW